MPITPDKVKELCKRVEGTKLDFKKADYDWTNKPTANAELSKDIMAMADSLNPSSIPSYILIGVDGNGTIVGVPPASHVDDAALHQKVSGILNEAPDFSYGPIDVDGMSVGVYEIRYSKRPFYPTKDIGPLRRNVALYRDGSSTKEATPEMIQEWAREDDSDARELRSLELLKLKADAQVRGRLQSVSRSTANNGFEAMVVVYNDGRSGFWVTGLRWRVEWSEHAWEAQRTATSRPIEVPEGYQSPQGEVRLAAERLVAPSDKVDFQFKWSYQDARNHIAETGLSMPGFSAKYGVYHFSIVCRGELGGEATFETSDRP